MTTLGKGADNQLSVRFFDFFFFNTFQWSFPPKPVSDLDVVVPTEVTPEEVHGSEIQNNLRKKKM